MFGIVAPEPVVNKLKQVTQQFLSAMQEADYNAVWNNLITLEADKLLSVALLPVHAYKDGTIEEVLKPTSYNKLSINLAEAFAFGFQKDIQQIRSSFFRGIATVMKSQGWYEAEFVGENTWAFVDGSSAILIETSSEPAMLLPFIKQEDGDYRVDFEVFMLFAMQTPPSILYNIGMRALEIGQRKSAIAYFELAASLSQPFYRIKRLMLDNFLVQQIITDTRKEELAEEERYILLARYQVLVLLSSPKVSLEPVNMRRFLESTFGGYCEIPNTQVSDQEVDQLHKLEDNQLRKAIASLLDGVNPVIAQREASKPHGPYEISDMELAVQHGEEIYRLSMPFKSGREISGPSVPVSIAYQIIRPFLYFPNGIVVLITAKPCSQHLHNYIKQANATLGLAIEVIENEELAKLLKTNSLL